MLTLNFHFDTINALSHLFKVSWERTDCVYIHFAPLKHDVLKCTHKWDAAKMQQSKMSMYCMLARQMLFLPRVSHGSFFQEQISRPVSRMAWSWRWPSRPASPDCHWQKLFRVWSAWWLITSPSWGSRELTRVKSRNKAKEWTNRMLLVTSAGRLTQTGPSNYQLPLLTPPQ